MDIVSTFHTILNVSSSSHIIEFYEVFDVWKIINSHCFQCSRGTEIRHLALDRPAQVLVQHHEGLQLLREGLHVLGHGVVAAGREDAQLHQVTRGHGIEVVRARAGAS